MGLAVVVKGADFSENNIGKVTLMRDVPVESIAIVCPSVVRGTEFQPTVEYSPEETIQRGVKNWALAEGLAYASINASTGKVTIHEGVTDMNITIVCASVFDEGVTAAKTVKVTYAETVGVLTGFEVSQPEGVVTGESYQLEVSYTPQNSSLTGCSFQMVEGAAYASVDAETGLVTFKEDTPPDTGRQIKVRATTTHGVVETEGSEEGEKLSSEVTFSIRYGVKVWDVGSEPGVLVAPGLYDALSASDHTVLLEMGDEFSKDGFGNSIVENYIVCLGKHNVAPQGFVNNNTQWNVTMANPNGDQSALWFGTGLWNGTGKAVASDRSSSYINFKGFSLLLPKSGQDGYVRGNNVAAWTKFLTDGTFSQVDPYAKQQLTSSNYHYTVPDVMTFGWALNDLVTSFDMGGSLKEWALANKSMMNLGRVTTLASLADLSAYDRPKMELKTLIVVPGNYQTKEELLAHRQEALIDIRVGGTVKAGGNPDGTPYNAGSLGVLHTVAKGELFES